MKINKNYLKYELGVNNEEEARRKCLEIIENIKNVIDIKEMVYIETFIRGINIDNKEE